MTIAVRWARAVAEEEEEEAEAAAVTAVKRKKKISVVTPLCNSLPWCSDAVEQAGRQAVEQQR